MNLIFTVSASFVPGADSNTTRQRHAPLYGRLVAEEHLPASHRDAVHQVCYVLYKSTIMLIGCKTLCCGQWYNY